MPAANNNIPAHSPKADHATLIQFVLEKAEECPVRLRIQLYRAVAVLLGETAEAKKLNALAYDFETTEAQALEFRFHIEYPKN